MDPNLPQLAQQTAAILAPCLPYLLTAGKQVATEAAKAVGTAAWEKAKSLWHVLWPKLERHPAALPAAKDLAAAPGNADLQAAFRVELRKLLESDPTLARQLAQMVIQSNTATASGERSVSVGGSATGATIITGDSNQITRPS